MVAHPSDLPLWCIVQADSDRVCMTSRGAVPIQYWSAPEDLPLMQRSLHRALRLAKPRHVVATVASAHQNWWSDRLWCVPAHRRVVDESSGRPTVTLAAALALIEREAGQDTLLVLQPTDSFYASESAFVAGVNRAIRALDRLPTHVVALTVEAYASEPSQDYLLLGARDGLPGRPAVKFIKRPHPMIAERLIALGAPLSTGVYVARLSTLTGIIAELWPDLMVAARSLAWTAAGQVLMPARMSGSQFCRPWRHTWVQRPLARLRAVAVDDFGWSSMQGSSATTPALPAQTPCCRANGATEPLAPEI
jgi:mannose-1-phosphate guanylyltransferase